MLRLRVEVQTIFTSEHEDISINEWQFPKQSLIIVPAGPAHRDPSFWNTRNGKHPVDQFWADRFLANPDDPQSGPRKNAAADGKDPGKTISHAVADKTRLKYVSSGLSNSYMPYGVGERMCPGRGFARREIVAFCALMVD